ncbi:MAG: hypothetical protein KJP03_05445 [Gammaproteobacteria bacterium]|nr:hypothetical protein [Gammaproteobacteria bacterium]
MQPIRKHLALLIVLGAGLTPLTSLAYVGPGAGISLLGALWGLIVGVVLALGVILIWPVRIMLRKRKAQKEAEAAAAGGTTGESAAHQATADTPTDEQHSST